MACNENMIKNVATEVTSNCVTQNVNVDIEFVSFLIELLLLNPKYGKQFAKTFNRRKLEHFVNECVDMFVCDNPCLNTLKMQFVMIKNYDQLPALLMKHQAHVDSVLKPLLDEIVDEDPDENNDAAFKILYRKICIYIFLASGLGSPTMSINFIEEMAALKSIYNLEDLHLFVTIPRVDKINKLHELLQVVSGVRLYNRDCKLGGDTIPDLPTDLVDASKNCLSALSNSLISVMQRVNLLTSAIVDQIVIEKETGNILISVPPGTDLNVSNYKHIFELLIFHRQFELYTRRLLSDMELIVLETQDLLELLKEVLVNLRVTCRFKSAMPVIRVYPLFVKLWEVWHKMQNTMFIVSTITRLSTTLDTMQERMQIPLIVQEVMLDGKPIMTDEQRLSMKSSVNETPIFSFQDVITTKKERLPTVFHIKEHVQYLGFCAVCLCQGALVPCNLRIRMKKYDGKLFGFCSSMMGVQFGKDPQRYINEVLDFARNHPQITILLNLRANVENVKETDELIVNFVPKVKNMDKDIQTDVHLEDKHIDKNYSWDLWEHKKLTCKLATTVGNCQTHSTQTKYSIMRSECQSQTVEPRDKNLQTSREVGVMTNICNSFYFDLRGRKNIKNLEPSHLEKKLKPLPVELCRWPCFGNMTNSKSRSLNQSGYYIYRGDKSGDDDE